MHNDLTVLWQRHKKRILALMYLAALLATAAGALAEPALFALGLRQERELTTADFTLVDAEPAGEGCVRTVTDDAQMHLALPDMHSLWVRCTFSLDPGEFVLFYQTDPEAPFSAAKAVYARQWGDWYAFPLPGGVRKLRLDLGVNQGNLVDFAQITLDRRTPPRLPTAGLVWAAVLPGLLFAALDLWMQSWAIAAPVLRRRARRPAGPAAPAPVKGRTIMTVTKDTIIADILQNDPQRESVAIFLSAGMHCLGCLAAHGETVAQACEVHGVDADALVEELNAYFAQIDG